MIINNETVSIAEIMKMAKELGMALASTREITEYREAESKIAKDPEACRLTRIFREANAALVELQSNPSSTKEEIDQAFARLEQSYKVMKSYPLIAEYYKAGAAFNNLLYQINQLLKFYCMEPGEETQFEQPGGCSSCNSCSNR